jgi:hypothetical protein
MKVPIRNESGTGSGDSMGRACNHLAIEEVGHAKG